VTGSAGPSGEIVCRFEDGLRFLAAALALNIDNRNSAAAISAACNALKCFIIIIEKAAKLHFEDPQNEINHLRDQCSALLTIGQEREEATMHALEAAKLARDQAARLLPGLLWSK